VTEPIPYWEALADEALEKNPGTGVTLCGMCTLHKADQLTIQDESAGIDVITTEKTSMGDSKLIGEVCMVFGVVQEGNVLAHAILPLHLDFSLFRRMREFERRTKRYSSEERRE
jgi:hypothetical protein